MEKNNKRKHIGLNCAIGALALLGSAGTITFGTLWCQSRKMPIPEQDDVTLNKTSLTLDINETETLFSKVGPDGASQEVTWTSSDESVAKVNSKGLVTAVSAGTATITVKAAHSSKTAKCDVEVVAQPEPPHVETIVMDQYEMQEDAYGKHYLFYSSQKITFEPNMEYKIYIDLTQLPTITSHCECNFKTPTNLEEWSEDENTVVPLCNPYDFVASGHHLFGTLAQGGVVDPGIYNEIVFSDYGDDAYIDSADYIDGFINTLDWKTQTYDPAYALFSISPTI